MVDCDLSGNAFEDSQEAYYQFRPKVSCIIYLSLHLILIMAIVVSKGFRIAHRRNNDSRSHTPSFIARYPNRKPHQAIRNTRDLYLQDPRSKPSLRADVRQGTRGG